MLKKNINEEFNIILKALKDFPQGASFKDIKKYFKYSIHQRTLQRRLTVLIKEGRIYAEGKTRSRKYRISMQRNLMIKKKSLKITPLILSKKGIEIQSKVTKSIKERPHVGYNREFLEKYKPNTTFYLSESLRKNLFEIGKTEDGKYPAGTYAKQIFDRLLIDLSWNSSRLEGNTYSLLETERLINLGIMTKGKDAKETQMILNHKEAIKFLIEFSKEIKISRYIILNLHALLSENLLHDSVCGRLRSIPISIGKSTYIPLDIPQLIDECFNQLIKKANAIEDPFEQSFFLMVHIPYLQPYEDVNKRTSRLASNIPLIKKNLCPLSFIDVPKKTYINALLGVYEFNQIDLLRDIFAWAYERSCILYSTARNILGEPDIFRMKNRDIIVKLISEIIRSCMDKKQAISAIKQKAIKSVIARDQTHFMEIVEKEIQNLHEGNIARYHILPSEYKKWKKTWR